ncbi:Aldehyde/histidinol dehydrogenase [Geopyxis carbonaria]|nr:Aldehyde/histidinol dehydrogenase [Geopyxis carbonaria]
MFSAPQCSRTLRPLAAATTRLATIATRPSRPRLFAASVRRRNATLAAFKVPKIENEPNQHFAKGSPERGSLEAALAKTKSEAPYDIPLHIGGKEVRTQEKQTQVMPADHATTLATSSSASAAQVTAAIDAALAAQSEWADLPFADRAAVFLKAADLVAGKHRHALLAATMLGQGKNAWQAEIDAAAELADFFRFNVAYAEELYAQQPAKNSPGVWNRVEHRPLEGFVYAVSPFNFTAIGGNLPAAPALMGNVVVWKPSPGALLSNHLVYQILLEAGLPPNVIQWVPGDAALVTSAVLSSPHFAALHYTGSTAVFRSLYGAIATGVVESRYRSYPRIVGETGGKNFHLLHASADVTAAVRHTVRGAFEYQGQKCSACSRVYVPQSLAGEFLPALAAETEQLKVGPPEDWTSFCGPVIHRGSFEKLARTIDEANKDPGLKRLAGGNHDDSRGFYITPSIYVADSPDHPLFSTELFGPVLVVYVYPDEQWEDTMALVDRSGGGYALTGAVFARDRRVIRQAENALRNAAGNFYINTKCTGAVVGQQPFGGARASGTNDKAGAVSLLGRFVSARSVKEEFGQPGGVGYPSNEV